jgi:hypothetical protein
MCAQNTFANMTQYRVDARNCEAKRQFVEPYVASCLFGKTACGRFSDIGFVAAGKKRGFCRLR